MKVISLSLQQVQQLQLLSHNYGKEAAKQKVSLLKKLSELRINKAAVIKPYHDVLLFIKACPDNSLLLKMAKAELERVTAAVKKIMNGNNYREQYSLSGSGIAGTSLIAQYSFAVTKWLTENFPASVSFESAAGNNETGTAILHTLFPNIEYHYTTQENCTLQKRITNLLGKDKNLLKNIIDLFERAGNRGKMTDVLYDQLKIFTEWKLEHPLNNRSFISSIPQKIFFHKHLEKRIIPDKIISSPDFQSVPLSKEQNKYLVNIARASLAFYCRETDPITYADENEAKLFSFNRGITIALFTMQQHRRLSIESYIGYMAFKNTIPVAYGGGWIFGERCKIGTNIYPPFRGGESAYIFAQVLRLYHHYFHIQRFIVKPYQFGKGNKEGLRSGAFWFYYKLGFRPVNSVIAEAAAKEYDNRKHTSAAMLKMFTKCNKELILQPLMPKDFDAALISRAITRHIIKRFKGSREEAINQSVKIIQQMLGIKNINRFSQKQQEHLQQFSLLISLLPQINQWKEKEKRQLLQLILSKTHHDERIYILQVQKHKRLMNELYDSFSK
ncbi:MAG: hypothetical protein ACM3H8_02005 [Sphingobacteriales bacterium]